ncbi:MAG: polysaccharide deacetylase, partial [Rhodobacteraceae bacterium]|nr:polysaccharide deacetylase [Paracoccaceae bacterium]
MKIDWSPLRHAIKHAENPRFWWRDDDAVAQTNALDQMLRLSETLRTPVQIAVIPGLLEPSLAPALDGTTARVLVHGWTHTNHAPAGEKKAEFRRADTAAIDELSQGMNILATNFGGRLDPVFVPPWNRVSPALYTPLADAGYRAISTY